MPQTEATTPRPDLIDSSQIYQTAPESVMIVKSNDLIEACYHLTLNEQRVILMLIGMLDRRTEPETIYAQRFRLYATDFAEQFGLEQAGAYKELVNVANRLFNRYVTIDQPDPDEPDLAYTKTRWVTAIDYLPGKGGISLMLAQKIVPYLMQLEREFTQYRLTAVKQMTSVYGFRLYELLMQWAGTGQREIELKWLRRVLQIEDKYPAVKDMKRYVIDPAIEQINAKTDMRVSYKQIKSGRSVTHLVFSFEFPSRQEERAAKPVSTTGQPQSLFTDDPDASATKTPLKTKLPSWKLG